MDVSPPIKPPRGVKSTKETSSVLMSLIDTLYNSSTNEERDREKSKLESEFKISDKKLDSLVLKHEGDLTKVMELFGTLSEEITSAKVKICQVKENLKSCKKLLHCKRDDLKKLWMEGLEYKYMIQLLEEIEKMTQVPKTLNTYLNKKHYLHATELLVEAVNLGKGSLVGVDAIKELSQELEQKKEQLHLKLVHELKQQLYSKPSQYALNLRRQGSKKEGLGNSTLRRSLELRNSARLKAANRRTIENSKVSDTEFEVFEDLESSDPEADSPKFLAILVKSLVLLEKLPFAVQGVKNDMQMELVQIIQRTSYHVSDFISMQGPLASTQSEKQAKQLALVELVQTLFEQFKEIGEAHEVFLQHLQRACKAYNVDVQLFNIKQYWSQVQVVLQQLLSDYLDIQNLSSDNPITDGYANPNDISAYFSRRKPQLKKKAMFKFDGSSSSLLMNNASDSASAGIHRRRDKIFLCPPNHNNILHIFIPFMHFVEDIEHILELPQGNKCTLHKFLSDYVMDTFLTRRHLETLQRIEQSVRASDAWKSTVLLDATTDYKPLLISTVNAEKLLREWRKVLTSLPFYGENIVKYACNALKEYRETCNAAYAGLVQPHTEERRICSAAWLKDEDISRFLKSLPNWQNLKAQQEHQARSVRRQVLRREHTLEEESPEDVRQRNRREAEILASNLGEGGVSASEILSDMSLLKELAQLQESMEWFSVQMLQFASDFRQAPSASVLNGAENPPPVSPTVLQQLTSVAQDFDELANTCLLLLHLEVRVQCFHYLLSQSDYNKQTHEPDPKVLELSRVLANVDEAMTSSLHPRKCKYIFEGLGHLIAKILISSAQYMQVIDEGGIQRMCRNVFALQQTLTNITMTREVALDHARHFFELFFLTPEEILSGIMEKGPEFSELEYMNAFQLLNRSQQGHNAGAVNVHLERLSDILGEVGVTV